MADLGFGSIDADQHYYESLDACTRHLDPAFKDRGIQVVTQGKRTFLMAGRELWRFIPNPTFDPVIVPGCTDLMFRGQVPEGIDPRSLSRVEPRRAEYQDAAARLAVLDEQGIERVFMFPTLGCGLEQALRFDVPAMMASVRAFNRWLEDDWGFDRAGRIMAAPIVCLADPDLALAEVDELVARGVRLVSMRPAPVPDGRGNGFSLGDPRHDAVWARLADAGIPVAFHLGDSGYEVISKYWGGPERFEPFFGISPVQKLVTSDRAIHDTIGSMLLDGVFHRHPALRVASVENGSDWVPLLAKRLHKMRNQMPSVFHEHPVDTLSRHVWVTPYYEEDLRKLADLIGVERVLFGSDWPHGEGLAEPNDFVKELHDFSDAEIRKVMRTNALELVGDTAS
jgi:predicted TIM-barrel fold metal-dependent hydrolase